MRETVEIRRKRLRFRSTHRGNKELDLLLGAFAERHLPSLSPAGLDAYEALIANPDPDIYAWITGAEPPPAEHDTEVMTLLKTLKIDAE